MAFAMRKPLVVLLLIELVAAIVLGQVATVHRSQLDRALMEWRQQPTAESEQAFVRQKRITEVQRWAFSGVEPPPARFWRRHDLPM